LGTPETPNLKIRGHYKELQRLSRVLKGRRTALGVNCKKTIMERVNESRSQVQKEKSIIPIGKLCWLKEVTRRDQPHPVREEVSAPMSVPRAH